MRNAWILLSCLVMATATFTGSLQAQELYLKGDKVTLLGLRLTLDSFVKGQGIWQATDGNAYIVESAKRQDKENYILTEIDLDKDKNVIKKWKSAYKIGSKTPFNLDGAAELPQVALVQKIENGKLLKRKVYRTSGSGQPYPVTGLDYYQIGDTATFSGKELKLHSFHKGVALWKGMDNRSYRVTIVKDRGSYRYALQQPKP